MSNAMTSHDCNKVVLKMYLALDGELSTDEMREFLFELDRCSCCFRSFEQEKSFRAFLVSKIERRCMPENALQKLRDTLGMPDIMRIS
jgi:hypothetical protein